MTRISWKTQSATAKVARRKCVRDQQGRDDRGLISSALWSKSGILFRFEQERFGLDPKSLSKSAKRRLRPPPRQRRVRLFAKVTGALIDAHTRQRKVSRLVEASRLENRRLWITLAPVRLQWMKAIACPKQAESTRSSALRSWVNISERGDAPRAPPLARSSTSTGHIMQGLQPAALI